MRITKKQIEAMLPGQVIIAKCVDAAEWDSAKRVSHFARKYITRDDGNTYKISQNIRELTVSVELSNNKYR